MSYSTTFKAVVVLALAGCAVTLAGCSSEPDHTSSLQQLADQARAAGSDDNALILDDGEVTDDEYFQAARGYQTCIRETGIVLPDPEMNPVDGVTLVFDTTEIIELSGANATKSQECEQQWQPVLLGYTSTHTFKMDEALLAAVATCMEDKGFTVPEDASEVADIVGNPDSDGGEQRGIAENCTYAEAERLFPDSPGFVFSY